jgi:hypothetical protein
VASSTENARSYDEARDRESPFQQQLQDPDDFEGWGDDDDDYNTDTMTSRSPFDQRKQTDAHSQQPLLKEDGPNRQSNTFAEADEEDYLARPPISRRSTFRSRTPPIVEDKNLTRRKYILASGFLVLSLISFVIQTETAVYIQHELHWDKPYCML